MKSDKEIPGAILSLDGYLAKDPEAGKTHDGKEVINLLIGLNGTPVDGKTTEDGKPYRPTWWVRISVWDDLIAPAKKLEKGTFISVTGKIQTREYEEKQYWDMRAESIRIIREAKALELKK